MKTRYYFIVFILLFVSGMYTVNIYSNRSIGDVVELKTFFGGKSEIDKEQMRQYNRTISRKVVDAAYEDGYARILDYKIEYVNGMEGYLEEQYLKHYPYEMGACLEAIKVNDSLYVYGYTNATIAEQDESGIRFSCDDRTENTIEVHSHPDIWVLYDMCAPSLGDLFHMTFMGYEYAIIVCGNENVTEIIVFG